MKILKCLLMLVTAPIILVLTLFVWLCMGLIYISGLVLGLLSMVIALLGVAVLITYSPQNGAILLVMAFLISPVQSQTKSVNAKMTGAVTIISRHFKIFISVPPSNAPDTVCIGQGTEFEICDPGLGVWVNDVNIIWNEKKQDNGR